MINLFRPAINLNCITDIESVLKSGYIGQGKKVEEFENELKELIGVENLLYVNSCTSAIHLALEDIERKHQLNYDTEVASTVLGCFASTSAILQSGFGIKWIDIDLDTCNIDLDDLERKLNGRTRIVLIVHWAGFPVDLERLSQIKFNYREKYGKELFIIEDCAHCFNSEFNYQWTGTQYGNYGCYSFQAIKFLTSVDGGMLIVPDEDSYKRCKLMRWFGLDRDKGESFRCAQNIKEPGFKYQPNDVFASIGLNNIDLALVNAERQNDIATEYFNFLEGDINGIKSLYKMYQFADDDDYLNFTPSFWLFTVRVERRDDFIRYMKDNGIEVGQIHNRMDGHDCVNKYKGINHKLPGMDIMEKEMVCLPNGWWLTDEEINYITETIKKGW